MKNLIIIILLAIASVACTNQNTNESKIEEGKVILSPKHFNIGEINKSTDDSIYNFEFDILNNDSDTIQILNIESSCNCLQMTSYPKYIAPGSHGVIKGKVNISKQSGHLSKAIFVNLKTDDIIVLRVIGEIK